MPLERILTYAGHEPHTVNDGAAALGAIAGMRPDAIVLDVMVPFVDGLEVCRRVRDKGVRARFSAHHPGRARFRPWP